MQIPEILYFCIRGIALLIEGVFALFHAGLRCIATAVMRREQLPCDLVVTTKSGGSFSGVLLAGEALQSGSTVGGAVPPPPDIDTTPPYVPTCDSPDCTAARWGRLAAGVAPPDELDDETWGH